jgi:hypothetical protein
MHLTSWINQINSGTRGTTGKVTRLLFYITVLEDEGQRLMETALSMLTCRTKILEHLTV